MPGHDLRRDPRRVEDVTPELVRERPVRPGVRGDEREDAGAERDEQVGAEARLVVAQLALEADRAAERGRQQQPEQRLGGREVRHAMPVWAAIASVLRGRRSPRPRRRPGRAARRAARARRVALGGRLHLDEPAVGGHDDVHVGLRGRVLGVVEVEQRAALDDPDRDRGHRARQRLREAEAVERARARRRTRRRSRRSGCRRRPGARRSRARASARRAPGSRTPTGAPGRSAAGSRSCGRPACPRDASRCVRSPVDAGRSEYSAVIQPRPERCSQRGTPSSTVAVQSTRVFPCE